MQLRLGILYVFKLQRGAEHFDAQCRSGAGEESGGENRRLDKTQTLLYDKIEEYSREKYLRKGKN